MNYKNIILDASNRNWQEFDDDGRVEPLLQDNYHNWGLHGNQMFSK